MELTTGTTGFRCQLSCVMLSPQLPPASIDKHGVGVIEGATVPTGFLFGGVGRSASTVSLRFIEASQLQRAS